MPTDKTPRDADETLALPVTDQEPTTGADDDDTVIADDDTVALPPAGTTTPAVDMTEGSAPDETRALPLTDETRPYPRTTAWSSQDEPAVYTSPIGALYAPTDRPDQVPADGVAQTTVVEPAPVEPAPVEPAPVDPPRRRLRVGTVVWGLVIAAIGVGLLAWAAGFAIDLQLAMIVLLAVAGTALLVGSIVSGARAARR
ncbi:hypothetical protein [Cellulomonas sp. Leaf395]|uniref:hypothetical protein n=1 Tax=Cellulomonas sp. Leaf395 TaxID=1736362 RepID=UPI0006F85897|nr:hypothetical protein [Cellulomonas sp. Leaf395]KQS99620.1 hypothetical protein ASG23_09655 [Cellulomonas sp. Leaf395]